MLHPLQSLFGHTPLPWGEADVKYYLQHYLQQRLKTEALYCERVTDGVATVRVASPAVQQEIQLLQFDIVAAVAQATTYSLKQVRVYIDR